ncbi:MAG: methyltransferase [Thermoplasmatales archaeon]|nr:methyltransferase [Thermoplasmatales archaeon]
MNKNSFHYKSLLIETHPEVYDPAEDTYLLLDAIDIKKNDSVLEIGTGCGIIALECARIGANVICTDINPIAVELVKKNYLMNQSILNGNFEIRLGDLFSPLLSSETFDVIIFNPPYLTTKKDDHVGGWYDVALNGGKSGLDATKRYIEGLPKFLKKNGEAYFVFSSLSDKKKIDSIIKKSNLDAKVIQDKKYNDETLSVYLLKK